MEKIPQQKTFDGLKIVLYGPESTGKSTLALQLARYFNTVTVEEFARDYLQEKYDVTGEICAYEDLLPIAIGQRLAENNAVLKANKFLFCDTDALETYIYSHAYFDRAPTELKEAVRKSDYDLYLLLDVDVDWTPDDLRDKPDDRNDMFQLFEKGLREFEKSYAIINGTGKMRFKNALKAIENLTD
ncbi:NadR type nicotinamide-nucleotide adenylyltransferase [Nonlabens dokdonensis]|jgi:NadR type nicotinamide-nucleotide adenylyltransferase|uniref:NadR type nicotinamide-nucleotide adenylyltransferase n=2 Tax=Nonlabens dokdonensis TaxID=328515 RepID=A0ABX5Q2V9_9FLAO|nr:ATP-binding protein [Nonlabens dokdonensis]AGC76647.1 putative nadR-like protein [Nonlabens dokdonensis DSW-6]PZX44296.1 NadR type nicotinamide-nucleotide adenylyltransferase [Nonlabens dokdonensis]